MSFGFCGCSDAMAGPAAGEAADCATGQIPPGRGGTC